MKVLEQQGKTIDDAIAKALAELHVSRDQIAVEILEEGSRGLFGLMGRPAKVRVSVVNQEESYNSIKQELQTEPAKEKTPSKPVEEKKPSERKLRPAQKKPEKPVEAKPIDEAQLQHIIDEAKKALDVILKNLQIEYTVEVRRRDEHILLNIHCDNENFLIGRRGTTLDAVQYLVNRIANKNLEEKVQVVLDTSDYRVNRKQRLEKLALRLSRRVKMTGKSVTVAPMNPHDRRIIHLTLQDDPAIRTLSRGTGFMRRIIISSSRNSNRNSSRSSNRNSNYGRKDM
ncbi:hypothetical protein CSA56_16185 [candidate division KSB3 bacterium]|uniref:RNA-binding protein KhpB n=1 Tax=candidate division KSB3 bacterium TaxID=2044937 RepID=A0A2G6K8W4_9BACT|nr:MAG: hypothetical protein CSA56_16185 [candidate division KSB3 bacterium]